jgi:hypothetical protein
MLAPLPSGQLESQSAIHGNPRFSLSAKCSSRFNQSPRSGYCVSWDQGLTWSAVQNFGQLANPNGLIQFWYASLADLGSGNIAAVCSQAFNNQNAVAWIDYRKMSVLAPL